MKFFIIGDEETVLGFSLAGVDGVVADTPEKSAEALKRAFAQKDMGIILITEKVAKPIKSLVEKYLYTTSFPLILEIPDRSGPIEGRPAIRDIIQKAVGVKL